MTESRASSRTPWIRWGLVGALLVAGIILLLVFGPGSTPLVSPGRGGALP
jgi:hypothetical protein